jgi:hypothetical protein
MSLFYVRGTSGVKEGCVAFDTGLSVTLWYINVDMNVLEVSLDGEFHGLVTNEDRVIDLPGGGWVAWNIEDGVAQVSREFDRNPTKFYLPAVEGSGADCLVDEKVKLSPFKECGYNLETICRHRVELRVK